MAQQKGGKKGKNGQKKYGRYKRKDAGKATALSAFVRGRITGEEYFRMTGQK